jgi:hypothetical protein
VSPADAAMPNTDIGRASMDAYDRQDLKAASRTV